VYTHGSTAVAPWETLAGGLDDVAGHFRSRSSLRFRARTETHAPATRWHTTQGYRSLRTDYRLSFDERSGTPVER